MLAQLLSNYRFNWHFRKFAIRRKFCGHSTSGPRKRWRRMAIASASSRLWLRLSSATSPQSGKMFFLTKRCHEANDQISTSGLYDSTQMEMARTPSVSSALTCSSKARARWTLKLTSGSAWSVLRAATTSPTAPRRNIISQEALDGSDWWNARSSSIPLTNTLMKADWQSFAM